ncbi:MAG: hypothetical protein ABSA84_07790 [Gammaproteobacteria bacterium]|jgi:hypothetical protein
MSNKNRNYYDAELDTRLEVVATTSSGPGSFSSVTNTTHGDKQVCNDKHKHKGKHHHKHGKDGECDGSCGKHNH